jgi:membrane protein DedA with SNARE-associated domain
LEDILNSLSTYGYIALFIYSLGGGFFGIIAASTLSYMGKMDMATSMLVAFASNYIGDMGLFYMARYNKEFIQPYMKNHRRKFALSNLLVKKYGDFVVFIQKFIYGVKTLVPIAMGFSKYSFVKFGILNIFASALFVAFFGYISYQSSEYIIKIASYIKEKPWIYPIVLITIGGSIYLYFEKVAGKKK